MRGFNKVLNKSMNAWMILAWMTRFFSNSLFHPYWIRSILYLLDQILSPNWTKNNNNKKKRWLNTLLFDIIYLYLKMVNKLPDKWAIVEVRSRKYWYLGQSKGLKHYFYENLHFPISDIIENTLDNCF